MKTTSLPLTLTSAAVLIFAVPVFAADDAAPKQLEFEITRGVNPAKAGTYTGKVRFERDDTKSVFKVTWTLVDGTVVHGWGVPYPKSGAMAVAYGNDAGGVAIYKKDGDKVDARWSLARDGNAIGEYSLQRGKTKGQLVTADGKGSITLTPTKVPDLATLRYEMAGGTYEGFAIAGGDYLAAATVYGGDDAGIVLYQMTPDLKVTGKWFVPGANSLGSEDMKLLTIDGKPAPADAAPAGDRAEVLALVKKIRGNKEELLKLKPTKQQIAQIAATDADAAALADYTDKIFGALPPSGVDGSKAEQTEINVFSVNDLPGGYAKYAAHLKPNLAIFGFEFLEPGESAGMSFDGLVKVDGKWVMIPGMWRAFQK